ncbi:MAG: triose-phosphate isomerase [Acidimicrobiia bacterium]|nr:triose-phosphate isomerase [bacterium]MXX44574.1 triose-phosphate isomerase [Acidimicrobiia bacterium]MYA39306.1 triose-phosphate isomerase [Acidimicrobiia bacterium]MYD40550.1 triose-phosphate isomerase [Acidimicrobiia bacterium]MYH05074.1 triose-phosphate isomerase [Acidimicrobiia bacterium]
MDRKSLIIGNWKMNLTHLEAIAVTQRLWYRLNPADFDRADVVIAPPFTCLRTLQTLILADRMPFALGAQHVHWEKDGAFTGEVSAGMLVKLDVGYVIVGHSERRAMFGETDELVRKRVRSVLSAGMTPVVCVGETVSQRESGETEMVVTTQLRGALRRLTAQQRADVVVAYEPVWAIGTGRHASADDAGEVCELLRNTVAAMGGPDAGEAVRILYGGSVNPGNIAGFMAKTHIDGALVGGASLDPDTFAAVIRYWM